MPVGLERQLPPDLPQAGDRIAIAPECLRVSTVAGFDIFVAFEGRDAPVLYREKHLPLTDDDLERLRDSQVLAVLIDAADTKAYHAYIADNLSEILKDDAVPVARRSALLYQCTTSLMQDVMHEPRARGMLARSIAVANDAVDFIANQGGAFEQLLQVASFDYYTYTHSMNVFMFSVALAQRIGIADPGELRALGQAVLLHDIGKSMVGEDVVNWRGPLDDDQWRRMKLHPVYGFDILAEQGLLCERGLKVVRHHHEKLGGGGYPDNLRGDQIGPWVRVTTICDIFDALTTKRPYKDAMESFPALSMMRDKMAPDLDPDYFEAFVKMMGERAG